ncbi:MarR family transcriptional regulator [Clostridium pasteurianum]|uniref:MarR family transcriptional regulator n=1 Tax=Clostridium pasteurianum TaxID=1501 RepID=UPI00068722DE|nr:MarR family transcriptional regulator [Clostridium pasteurianum]
MCQLLLNFSLKITILANITPNQSEVLMILSKKEPLSLKELGELLICESKSPSRLVQRLVDNGFVYKSKEIDDNRKSVLHLTQEGRRLIPLITEKKMIFNQVLSDSIADKIDISVLNDVLRTQIKDTNSEEKIEIRKDI